ncbi:MAG TPA: DUF2975 domain-containing protein [Niabella sp.]|nr:DUF2975 domain-containing protein [Niabella sp.]
MNRLQQLLNPLNTLFIVIVILSFYFFITKDMREYFGKEYGIEISPLSIRDKSKKDSVISVEYNTARTAYLETTAKETLRVKSHSNMGRYLLISEIIEMILFFVIFWMIIKMYNNLIKSRTFDNTLDTILFKIGIILIIIGCLTLLNHLIINQYLKNNGFSSFRAIKRDFSYFFFAFLAFAFSGIYKSGKVLKQENDLTV